MAPIRCDCGEEFDDDDYHDVVASNHHRHHMTMAALRLILEGIERMSDQQAQVNADVATILADIEALKGEISAELAAVKAANPTVDLSTLDNAVARLNDVVTANAAPAVPAPAPAPAPTEPTVPPTVLVVETGGRPFRRQSAGPTKSP